MVDVNTEVLQAQSQSLYGLDYPGGLRLATGLNSDPNGICRALWQKEFNACRDELLYLTANRGLLLDGNAGSYLSTPDAVALDIIADIDIRWEGVDYGKQANVFLLSKWTETTQKSYNINRSAFGTWGVQWTTAGTTNLGESTIPSQVVTAFRATIDVVNSTNRIISFYRAPTMDDAWTLMEQFVRAGNTSIFAGTAPLLIGAINAGAAGNFFGRFTRAQVRNGIDGTIVANPDIRALTPGQTSFVDSAGLTWTLNGGARIV